MAHKAGKPETVKTQKLRAHTRKKCIKCHENKMKLIHANFKETLASAFSDLKKDRVGWPDDIQQMQTECDDYVVDILDSINEMFTDIRDNGDPFDKSNLKNLPGFKGTTEYETYTEYRFWRPPQNIEFLLEEYFKTYLLDTYVYTFTTKTALRDAGTILLAYNRVLK